MERPLHCACAHPHQLCHCKWLLPIHFHKNTAACILYRQVSHAELKPCNIQMFFSVPEGCHRRKGKQCLLKLWNTIVSLDNCLMSRTEKWSTGCACDILQMPVLVLRAALLPQRPISDIHTWIGTIWWWPFPSKSAPAPRCFLTLTSDKLLKAMQIPNATFLYAPP